MCWIFGIGPHICINVLDIWCWTPFCINVLYIWCWTHICIDALDIWCWTPNLYRQFSTRVGDVLNITPVTFTPKGQFLAPVLAYVDQVNIRRLINSTSCKLFLKYVLTGNRTRDRSSKRRPWFHAHLPLASPDGWCSQYHTDHLHVPRIILLPILGWLHLGAKVHFFKNSYYAATWIYEHLICSEAC